MREAHPRVSGENMHFYVTAEQAQGSSPRERGKLCGCGAVKTGGGLIPA